MARYKKRQLKELTNLLILLSLIPGLFLYSKTHNLILSTGVFILSIIAFIAAIRTKKYLYHRKLLNSGVNEIDKMPGEQFEQLLLQHFRLIGYSGYVTRGSQDYGADLLVKKNNISIVIQAKRWKSKVGIEAVQQIVAALKHYKAQQGIVVTNNYFTKNAVNLAKSNNILLWDRDKLISILLEKKEEIPNENLPKDTCPECGKKLIQRNGKRGFFIGCSGYPACKYTRDI